MLSGSPFWPKFHSVGKNSGVGSKYSARSRKIRSSALPLVLAKRTNGCLGATTATTARSQERVQIHQTPVAASAKTKPTRTRRLNSNFPMRIVVSLFRKACRLLRFRRQLHVGKTHRFRHFAQFQNILHRHLPVRSHQH